MALFGFLSRKGGPPAPPSSPLDPRVVDELYERACAYVQDADGRIHVEDLISALAATTGEACLAQTGEVDIDDPASTPGSRVLSDAMNRLLSGDVADWAEAPGDSIFGIIRRCATAGGYPEAAFPTLAEVYAVLVKGHGEVAWGWVPLSPEGHKPLLMPLRAAYEQRATVAAIWSAHGVPAGDRAILCALALGKTLTAVKAAIDPGAALRIALETVNGMAKTTPVNVAHMQEMTRSAGPAA